ncbi:hypothetical protein [Sphingomonas sp. LT1P40]|uniref:hypothetical protein n=1 Tax=Alteristakelama amylovorans TaxID=3096166 RepID=UPI002FC6357D
MDINYLLYRHQVSLMRYDAAACVSSRRAHRDLAHGYASRIRDLQVTLGSAGTPMVAAA